MNDTHDKVALTVVRALGIAAIVGLLVVGGLCYVALQYGGDSSTVAVIAIVGNLASAALASLGSILSSTNKGVPQPAGTAADPVNVQTAEKPLEVTPVAADVHPDAPAESDL
jgi:hypothetical protein